jgi:hypothetical protein
MSEACSMNGGEEECIYVIGGKVRRKETTRTRKIKMLVRDNIKIDVGEMVWGGMNWIGLAQDRDKCRDLVNGNEPPGFHKMLGNP